MGNSEFDNFFRGDSTDKSDDLINKSTKEENKSLLNHTTKKQLTDTDGNKAKKQSKSDDAKAPKVGRFAKKMSKKKKIIIASVSSIVFILVVVATAISVIMYSMVNNVQTEEVHYIDEGGPRPPVDLEAGKSVNILMIGVDSRDSEENQKIGGNAKDLVGLHNSDTTILMHISSNRSRIDAISIPRDTIINAPQCTLKDGKSTPARNSVMFNSVFFTAWNVSEDDYSAGQCVQKAVENMTNLRIDYLAIADFAGFESMVNALNGVDICVQEPINAPAAGGLILPKGMNHLNGFQAISYARARHGTGLGDQSDLSRIGRQQKLVGSIIKTLLQKNFTDIFTLTSFVSSATSSLKTTIPANKLIGFMWSLKGIKLDNVFFIMTPVEAYKYNKNRVVFSDDVEVMWSNIKKDRPLVTQDEDAEPEDSSKSLVDQNSGLEFRTAFGADSCE